MVAPAATTARRDLPADSTWTPRRNQPTPTTGPTDRTTASSRGRPAAAARIASRLWITLWGSAATRLAHLQLRRLKSKWPVDVALLILVHPDRSVRAGAVHALNRSDDDRAASASGGGGSSIPLGSSPEGTLGLAGSQ
jgi:hypothetical protein